MAASITQVTTLLIAAVASASGKRTGGGGGGGGGAGGSHATSAAGGRVRGGSSSGGGSFDDLCPGTVFKVRMGGCGTCRSCIKAMRPVCAVPMRIPTSTWSMARDICPDQIGSTETRDKEVHSFSGLAKIFSTYTLIPKLGEPQGAGRLGVDAGGLKCEAFNSIQFYAAVQSYPLVALVHLSLLY